MRVRAEHWQLLIDICEKHPELITNKFNGPDGKTKGHALWQNVAQMLNSLGFGEKSKDEWRKALIDWKCKTKAKASKIKQEVQKTGGGPANYIPLSDLEKRLLGLMGTKAIEGDDVQELGFGKVTIPFSLSVEQPENKTDEHNYCHQEIENTYTNLSIVTQPMSSINEDLNKNLPMITNSQVVANNGLKRKFSETRRPNRRVRTKETLDLSHKLIDINLESLQILRDINQNMENIAGSLSIIASSVHNNLEDIV